MDDLTPMERTLIAAHEEIQRLRAELADAKRAGWIAGRDAAAEVLTGVHGSAAPIDAVSWRIGVEDGLAALRKTIRNMEPPA